MVAIRGMRHDSISFFYGVDFGLCECRKCIREKGVGTLVTAGRVFMLRIKQNNKITSLPFSDSLKYISLPNSKPFQSKR